ncbi:MAG TPA: hypothetical protein H9946_10380 [Candidatus Jeotgalibaca pullicola]|nr:hypothetical protein [Candidatus Jeotgalibaca pullicola]
MIKKNWLLPIIIIILIGIILYGWQRNIRYEEMAKSLSSIPFVDSILVKDAKNEEKILNLTQEDPIFDELKNIYQTYYDLDWSQRKLLNGEPLFYVEYLVEDEKRHTVSIYQIDNEQISLIPEDQWTGTRTITYNYLNSDNTRPYILVIEKLNQIISFSEGTKKLINDLEDIIEAFFFF